MTDSLVELFDGALDIINGLRERDAPHEACGLFFGRLIQQPGDHGHTFACQVLKELKSAKRSPVYFEIDPVVQYQVTTEEEAKGRSLVGVLHTHPGAQFVSSTDAKYMRNFARFFRVCWVIAGDGRDGMELGAYEVDPEGKIVSIPVRTRADKGL